MQFVIDPPAPGMFPILLPPEVDWYRGGGAREMQIQDRIQYRPM